METALSTAVAANYRTESRGAHAALTTQIVMMKTGYVILFIIRKLKR